MKFAVKMSSIFAFLIFLPLTSNAMKEMKFDGDRAAQKLSEKLTEKLAKSATAMDCQIFSSDYQEVRILDLRDGTFALRTLDSTGATAFFELTSKEWPASKVKIPCWRAPHAICGEMTLNSVNAWEYELTGISGVAEGNCH